jgi:hypothetical protein
MSEMGPKSTGRTKPPVLVFPQFPETRRQFRAFNLRRTAETGLCGSIRPVRISGSGPAEPPGFSLAMLEHASRHTSVRRSAGAAPVAGRAIFSDQIGNNFQKAVAAPGQSRLAPSGRHRPMSIGTRPDASSRSTSIRRTVSPSSKSQKRMVGHHSALGAMSSRSAKTPSSVASRRMDASISRPTGVAISRQRPWRAAFPRRRPQSVWCASPISPRAAKRSAIRAFQAPRRISPRRGWRSVPTAA